MGRRVLIDFEKDHLCAAPSHSGMWSLGVLGYAYVRVSLQLVRVTHVSVSIVAKDWFALR